MASKARQHELEGLELAHRFDWSEVSGDALVGCVKQAFDWGYSMRLGPVGYGIAARFVLTDVDGNVFGVTLGNGGELNALLRGLLSPGADDYVKRHQEPARGRRRR